MHKIPTTISEQFSNYLAMAMDERQISQQQLANKMHCSLSLVNNMVNGRNTQSLDMWQRAFKVLGVEVGLRISTEKS